MGITDKVSYFIARTAAKDIPQDAVVLARLGISDFIGVALAGSREEQSQIIADYAGKMGSAPQASLIGRDFKTSPYLAAVVNGTTGHALDYDDMAISLIGHPSVFLAPAILAIGESIGASGEDILAAYVVGYETACCIAGHLFIFYFAILSALTPPVCIAVFTASAISGARWLQIAVIAMALGIGGYIIPFYFIFDPALLMQGEPVNIIIHTLTALAGVFFLAVGILGHWFKSVTILERLLFIAAGLALMHPALVTDGIGVALAASGWFSQRLMPAIPVIGTRPASPSTSEDEHK